MKKSEIIETLELTPLEMEGGYYKEVYRAKLLIDKSTLPKSFKAPQYCASTSIYYLLGKDDKSKMHAVPADETWHFYTANTPDIYIELLLLFEDGSSKIINLGSDIAKGELPQYTIMANTMMGARIASHQSQLDTNSWALLGATVAPSFEYEDFILGDPILLAQSHPQHAQLIKELS